MSAALSPPPPASDVDVQRIGEAADVPGKISNPARMDVPTVSTPEQWEALPYGREYLDPAGQKRGKFRQVTDEATYAQIGDGETYLGPDGKKRTRPHAENVSLGTQTLYGMAAGDPNLQRSILARVYGSDAVKQDAKGLYVEMPDGKRFRPDSHGGGLRSDLTRGFGEAAASALPVAGAIGGALAGGPAGGVGSFAGAGLGYAGGVEANRSILALAGFPSQKTLGERTKDVAKETLEGGAFEAGGRLLGSAAGSVISGLKTGYDFGVKPLAQLLARSITGTTPDVIREVLPLAEKGVRIPPEMWAPETPMAHLTMRAAKTYGIDPVTPSVEKFANEELSALLKKMGVPEEEIGQPLARTAAVDFTPAGEAAHRDYAGMLAESDGKVRAAFDKLAAEATARGEAAAAENTKATAEAARAVAENRAAAQRVVDATWSDINTVISDLQAGTAGGAPGDLVRTVAGRVSALRDALSARFKEQYGKIDQLSGGTPIDATPVSAAADEFIALLPEEITKNHPALIRALSELQESGSLTLAQARHIRSMLGDLADWRTIAPSFRNGQWKYFRGVLDQAIHNEANPPVVKEAVALLDATDRDYAREMARFKSPTVQRLMDWTEANMPPSQGELAGMVMKPGQEETRRELKSIMGQNPWNAVIGADMQAALDASKTTMQGVYDGGRFVQEFLERERQGILADYPRAAADLMRRQAQYVEAITGKGQYYLDMKLRPNETFEVAMRQAFEAAKEAERLAKEKPLEVMKGALKDIEAKRAAALATTEEGRTTNPLHRLLSNESAKVAQSAKHIIDDPDLSVAAWKMFRGTPTMDLIRSTWLRDLLTAAETTGAKSMYDRVTRHTPLQQEIAFGANAEDVLLVTRQLKMLLQETGDIGAGLYGTGTVTHPGNAPVPGLHGFQRLAGNVPFVTTGLRILNSAALKIMTNFLTSPGLVKFVAGGLKGNAEEQKIAKEIIARYAKMGSVAGAGAGATTLTPPPSSTPPPPEMPQDWRSTLETTP